jgi:hypothetical protein
MLRLILALVLAIASLPVPALACDGPAPMAMPGHAMGGMEHKAPIRVAHDCIGCIAVVDWDAERIVPPATLLAPDPIGRIVPLPLVPGKAPTPPPPRAA